MDKNNDDMLTQVQHYRDLQLHYEAIDAAIDTLLTNHQTDTGGLAPDDLARYRSLFQQRAEVLNEMRILEQILFDEE
jgi:hypothetical protein